MAASFCVLSDHSGSLTTSIQSMAPDISKSSSGVNSAAELDEPHAGKTDLNRFMLSSQ
jgi:hypothetical protein